FDVGGRPSGATLAPDGKPHKVRIRALHPHHAWTLQGREAAGKPPGRWKVELIRNGRVAKAWDVDRDDVELTTTVAASTPCWYAVRVYGADRRWQVALASPVYFADRPASAKRPPLTRPSGGGSTTSTPAGSGAGRSR